MAHPYWRYTEGGPPQPPPPPPRQATPPPLIGKRPRSDYDTPGREDERGPQLVVKDSDTMGASYDRYLQGMQFPPSAAVESTRPMSSGLGVGARPLEDPRMMESGGRPEIALPSDASCTLYVEGLPPNCSRREVAHIFRPFVGYKEVRLVTKESRHVSGDPLVLCFVDFGSPAEAATAKDALQGYKFDEHERDSVSLRLQFARYPGVRSGGGHRGGRR